MSSHNGVDAIDLQGSEEAEALAEEVERWRLAKEAGNAELQAISDDYKDRMAAIRMDAD
jgi:hypothetical protein